MENDDLLQKTDETEDEKAFVDFIIALVLILVSIAVVITSIVYWKAQDIEFYASAGFLPSIIGVVLFALGIKLLIENLKESSFKERCSEIRSAARHAVKDKKVYKTLAGLAIFAIYIFLLLGKVSFSISSFIVLWAILLLNKFDKTFKTVWKTGLIALISVAVIILIFDVAFHVPMP